MTVEGGQSSTENNIRVLPKRRNTDVTPPLFSAGGYLSVLYHAAVAQLVIFYPAL